MRRLVIPTLLVLLFCHTGGCAPEASDAEATNVEDSNSDAEDNDFDIGENDADAGDNDGNTANNYANPDCVPDESTWHETIEPTVDTYCGDCHGDPPDHGAPYSLTDYDALVDDSDGLRKVDAMAGELIDGRMPPPGYPPLDHADLDTLVAWATCGEEHPDYGAELDASAPVWEAPEEAPEGLDYFDVTAENYEVGPDVVDDYRCFAIEVPVESDRFIRRIEPVIDDGRVLHHSLVSVDRSQNVSPGSFSCPLFPPGDEFLYAWGPGQTALEFDDGGIRIGADDRIVLQLHYNNGAGFHNVTDSSGMRVFYDDPADTEYAMDEVEIMAIDIPPEATAEETTTCTVRHDVDLVATWPHMHEIGDEFEQVVHRQDGTTETVVELTGWHFEAQYLYHTPMSLEEGDELSITCRWDNPHDRSVRFGTGTEDEMCFSFMYFTPSYASFCR